MEKIIFFSDEDIWMMNPDGTGAEEIIDHPAAERWGSLSPDGKWLAFQSDRDGDDDIFIQELGTNNEPINITADHSGYDGVPRWSGILDDGTSKIAFESLRGGSIAIWTVTMNNGTPTESPNQITQPGQPFPVEGDALPNWHPEGNKIVFTSTQGHQNAWSIWEVDADGTFTETEIIEIFQRHEYAPAYSTDGSQIAWCHDDQIWIADSDGNPGSRAALPTPGADNYPIWSPDGETIAFSSNSGGSWDIWTLALDGYDLTNFSHAGSDFISDWGYVDIEPIPEPATMLLLGSGLIGLAGTRRKLKKK